jgi:predicted N-acetyltransferase YhbS
MEGPRSPDMAEFAQVLKFLDKELRPESAWSIEAEYPTALTKSNLHNMRIITDHDQVLSHAVLKPLIVRTPIAILKVGAIGSVVTNEQSRNQGLSKKILENCIEEAAKQDCDIAMLWTSLYDFYRKLDFELAGAETSVVIEENFTAPEASGLKFATGNQVSPEAIQRLYLQHSVTTTRSIEEIRKFLKIPQSSVHTAWDSSGNLVAYAIEGKGVDLTGYIHEWGGKVSSIMALLSYVRKQHTSAITIILPKHSSNLFEKLQKLQVTVNQGYLGMIKIINFDSLAGKIKRAARASGIADLVLEKRGNEFVFGLGPDLVIISDEKTMTQVLFGPMPEIESFEKQTAERLEKILPLPFWIWGWDSV